MSDYKTVETRASYGVGRNMGEQLAANPFEGLDIAAVQQGLADAFNRVESAVSHADLNEAFRTINERMQEAKAEQAKVAAAEGEAYLEENAKRDEVTVTESGLQYEVLTEGDGEIPTAESTIKAHYHGTLVDGTVFDSSVSRGQPAEFPVGGVIKGWTEALQMMKVGSKYRLHIPHHLAYGEQGAGAAIGPFQALIFDVELLEIVG